MSMHDITLYMHVGGVSYSYRYMYIAMACKCSTSERNVRCD